MTTERYLWILFGVLGVLLLLGLVGGLYPKVAGMINAI